MHNINDYNVINNRELGATPIVNTNNGQSNEHTVASTNLVRRATTSFSSQSTQQYTDVKSRDIQFSSPLSAQYSKTIEIMPGIEVADYTEERNFLNILLSMSFDGLNSLKNEINRYFSKYPMPCMAITAAGFTQEINQIFEQLNLTKEEKKILCEFLVELDALAPLYPYEQSLIITEKFLLYKSFLEYKFLMFSNASKKKELKNYSCDLDCTNMLGSVRINRLGELDNTFKKECSLEKLKQLPWSQLLKNNTKFEEELLIIYYNKNLGSTSNKYIEFDGGFKALKSHKILIPYTGDISIELFNQLWASPVNLVRCTFKLLTSDYRFEHYVPYTKYSLPSTFFEKNLRIISQKLFSLDSQEYLLQFIQQIYFYREHFNGYIDFRTIEIALFYSLYQHCKGGVINDRNLENNFEKLYTSIHSDLFLVFSEKYEGLTNKSIKIAGWWLFNLNTYFKQGKQFSWIISQIQMDIHSGLLSREFVKGSHGSDQHLINTDKDAVSPIRQELSQQVKEHQKRFISIGVNPSRLVNLLFILDKKYPQSMTILPPDKIHEEIGNFKYHYRKEMMWLKYYLNTDTTSSNVQRIKSACKEYNKEKLLRFINRTRIRVNNMVNNIAQAPQNIASRLENTDDRTYHRSYPIFPVYNYLTGY